jgi:outer membrane receptor for ferrienterochelin and colicins
VTYQGAFGNRGAHAYAAANLDFASQDGLPLSPDGPALRVPATSRLLGGLRGGARLAGVDVSLRGRWLRSRTDGLDAQTYPGLGSYLIDSLGPTNRFALDALGTVRAGRATTWRLSLAGHSVDAEAFTGPRGSPSGQTQRRLQTTEAIELTATIAEGARTWVAGSRLESQVAQQDLDQTQAVEGGQLTSIRPELASRRLTAGALHGQLQWKVGRLTVLPRLRGEHHGEAGCVLPPRLAAAFRVDDGLVFPASVGRGFRAPSADVHAAWSDTIDARQTVARRASAVGKRLHEELSRIEGPEPSGGAGDAGDRRDRIAQALSRYLADPTPIGAVTSSRRADLRRMGPR